MKSGKGKKRKTKSVKPVERNKSECKRAKKEYACERLEDEMAAKSKNFKKGNGTKGKLKLKMKKEKHNKNEDTQNKKYRNIEFTKYLEATTASKECESDEETIVNRNLEKRNEEQHENKDTKEKEDTREMTNNVNSDEEVEHLEEGSFLWGLLKGPVQKDKEKGKK